MPPTEFHGIRYRDLPDPRRYDNPAERIRSAIFFVGAYARRLADDIERMERTDKLYPDALNGRYYIASNADDPTTLEEPYEPYGERVDDHIRDTIESMFTLRRMAKTARELVESDGTFMDGFGESADRRWTTRAVQAIVNVRNSALHGHPPDAWPSALPMLHAGVAQHVRKTAPILDEFVRVARFVVVPPKLIAPFGTTDSQKQTPERDQDRQPTPLAGLPITKDHKLILEFLVRQPLLCTQTDMAGENGCGIRNRETLKPLLDDLETWDFLRRPKGKNKGYRATQLGVEWMRENASAI